MIGAALATIAASIEPWTDEAGPWLATTGLAALLALVIGAGGVLAELLHGETLILAGASHPCYLDRPDEFHRAVLEFVAGL